MDLNTSHNFSSDDECIVLPLSPPAPARSPSLDTETPQRSTSKIRLSKADSAQRRSERDAKKAEEEAIRAEKKRLKDELKAKKAEELQLEKARKIEELQQEKERKARKAEELQQEKARKAEELQQEKARKAEELQQEKARKAEELQQEKARRAEERARKEAENADKKAEQKQKKEQRQAAQQKQEILNKQMATYMGKFFKPVDKSSSKDGLNGTINNTNQRCTEDFDLIVSKQDTTFISDVLDEIKSMEKIDPEIYSRPRLNSESNSNPSIVAVATTSSYLIKTRYIHFPEKYFNRPPYYGSFKKRLSAHIDPLKPDASIENVDYTVDSEGEWEEPCKDGEELRSDAEDLSDSEAMDSDSDTDSFIVPHGHLSDDELNEDELQQSTSTKQAREAAKSHVWDKKVARRNQQREQKPIFACIYDPVLDDKAKFELADYLNQFRKISVPKEYCSRVGQEEKDEEINDESAPKEEKAKRMSKKKSLIIKKGLVTDPQVQIQTMNTPMATTPTTAKRTGSASNIVEGASPSKRRKMNSNENRSTIEDSDVLMTDLDAMNTSKSNILEDASNVTDIKSSPLTIICNDEVKLDITPTFTLLIPKRKQPPI